MTNQQCPTMEAAEAAALLGFTRAHFSRRKKDLIAREGMPAPLPGGRFSRSAFLRWVETYGERKTREAETSIASVRASWDRARLEARYLGRAA